nr:uncharacterized mitochondrial protein AtMg00810-like [Tanacetum cinerariifolium]
MVNMASEQSISGPALHEMTPATISSGLLPNPPSSTPFVPPLKTDWDMLFQLLFDELLTLPPSVDHPSPGVIALITEVVAPEPAASTGLPSSTTVDQDAPSPKVSSDQSSSTDFIHTVVHPDHQIPENNSKWTKDHPLENIIGELARPVSTRLQLHEQALFCYYDAFLTSVEPKMYKDALTQSYLQSEARRTGRDPKEQGSANGSCYHQEEGIDFEESFALVARIESIRIFLAFAAHMNMVIYEMDEKIAFLNGDLQKEISQSPRGIFINQLKYALESLKKYHFESCDPVDTPMAEKSKLDEDKEGKVVDPSHYRGMIGTLLYLTTSRPDLQFSICMCARYQARPIKKHLHAVKRIFRYLRGTVNRGLWYPKDSSITLTAFADADHAGCQDTRRSTSDSMQFLGDRLEHVEKGVIELYFVNTEYQLANIFTKAFGRERIEFLINKLGMRSFMSETLKQLANEVEE